jgi:hypothetical protein
MCGCAPITPKRECSFVSHNSEPPDRAGEGRTIEQRLLIYRCSWRVGISLLGSVSRFNLANNWRPSGWGIAARPPVASFGLSGGALEQQVAGEGTGWALGGVDVDVERRAGQQLPRQVLQGDADQIGIGDGA